MNRPLLTIAIPTFNRARKLRQSLERVVDYAAGKPVEILVSDNCSTDPTEETMRAFVREHPEVVYHRNETNIGPDANFLYCLNHASGEYVILLGDDDLVVRKGFETLLAALEKRPLFVHLNSSGYTLRGGEPVATAARFAERGAVEYADKEAFLRDIGPYITFMSALVFRTDYVRAVPDKEQYIGTYFIQSHIALQTMRHAGTCVLCTDNFCMASPNWTASYDPYFVWGTCYNELFLKTAREAGISQETVDAILRGTLRDLTILAFVLPFRFRDRGRTSGAWRKECLTPYVARFPELVRWLKFAMDCPWPLTAPLWVFIKAARRLGFKLF